MRIFKDQEETLYQLAQEMLNLESGLKLFAEGQLLPAPHKAYLQFQQGKIQEKIYPSYGVLIMPRDTFYALRNTLLEVVAKLAPQIAPYHNSRRMVYNHSQQYTRVSTEITRREINTDFTFLIGAFHWLFIDLAELIRTPEEVNKLPVHYQYYHLNGIVYDVYDELLFPHDTFITRRLEYRDFHFLQKYHSQKIRFCRHRRGRYSIVEKFGGSDLEPGNFTHLREPVYWATEKESLILGQKEKCGKCQVPLFGDNYGSGNRVRCPFCMHSFGGREKLPEPILRFHHPGSLEGILENLPPEEQELIRISFWPLIRINEHIYIFLKDGRPAYLGAYSWGRLQKFYQEPQEIYQRWGYQDMKEFFQEVTCFLFESYFKN